MLVSWDYKNITVPLHQGNITVGNASASGNGLTQSEVVWTRDGLDPSTLHVLQIQLLPNSAEGDRINFEKLMIVPGPQSPIPAIVPSPLPSSESSRFSMRMANTLTVPSLSEF